VKKSRGIVRHSARQIEEMRKRGHDRTDYERLDRMAPEEVEALAAADDEGEFDWSNAKVDLPGPKQQLTVRLDKEVIDWFRSQGTGYQTRMNAVLKSFVEAQRARRG
jgi:uncharacterized protein (DUF4415 family)